MISLTQLIALGILSPPVIIADANDPVYLIDSLGNYIVTNDGERILTADAFAVS